MNEKERERRTSDRVDLKEPKLVIQLALEVRDQWNYVDEVDLQEMSKSL